jgi:hypothetical protein
VDHAGTNGHHLADLGAQAREVSGENRGRHPPPGEQLPGLDQIDLSIEPPQCWQSMSSEALMRVIV